MIPSGVEIFVGVEPIDLRWSFDRLAGIVEERLGLVACGGALFVFFGKRRTALKVFFYDGSGLCLFYKRLDKGTFRLPMPSRADATSIIVDERELDDLLAGIAVELPARKRRARRAVKPTVH